MKVLALLVLFSATVVFGQNPYEYVDDALLQRVGQIIFDYDQQVARGRSGGSSSSNSNAVPYPEVYKSQSPRQSYNSAPVVQQQQQVYRNQRQYNAAPVAPQQQYQQTYRNQRQYNVAPVQQQQQQTYISQRQYNVAPVQQQQQTYRSQRQYNIAPVQQQQPQAYRSQAPQVYQNTRSQRQLNTQVPAVQPRRYEEPQQENKNAGFLGYTLSEPVPVPRVAEFHFTDGEGSSNGYTKNANNNNYNSNNNGLRYNQNAGNNNRDGFQLA